MKKTFIPIAVALLICTQAFAQVADTSSIADVQSPSAESSHAIHPTVESLHPPTPDALPDLPAGPLILTSVTPDQLSADYWINRLPNPDQLLKDDKDIARFNEDIHLAFSDCPDIFKIGTTKSGKSVRDQLTLEFNAVRGRGLYKVDDSVVQKSFFDTAVKPVMNIEAVPDKIQIKWGAAVRETSVRALPHTIRLLEKKKDYEFDMMQFTHIKLWTPVAVLHQSSDGLWYYIQAEYTRGWVKAKDIAIFPTRNELKEYVKSDSFLVVTGDRVPIFSQPDLSRLVQRPSMGTRIPLAEKRSNAYAVYMPVRKADGSYRLAKGYIGLRVDVSTKFLPFTQRNILRQAFKLLGTRYGWGNNYNGRDCSGFIFDVYLPFGIDMPRASKSQGFMGTQLGHFPYKEDTEGKNSVLQNATPGITLLRMPSHQMIYLGQVNGQYYVIHCTWAERYSMTSDDKNRINQVVVSDLTLNGNSHLGSLFDRIISMNEIN